ncbi:MAG TPA: hypothetical protein V6D17_05865 [Candidatus Obscuribacterales bacterium]
MGHEVDERTDSRSGAGTAHLGNALDEIYQARLQQQFIQHPESAPINTTAATHSFINQAWKNVAEPLLKGLNDWEQHTPDMTYMEYQTGLERQDEPGRWRDVDLSAAEKAYNAFPTLAEHGIPQSMVAGIILNEVRHRGDPRDVGEDLSAQLIGTVRNWNGTENLSASVGPAQMQIGNIKHLVDKYPQLEQFGADPVRAALDPKTAPMFVAAYLSEKVEGLENHNKTHPDQKIAINPATIAYTYNPDVFSKDGEYRAKTAAEKLESGLGNHAIMNGWKPERLPLNEQITGRSTVVANILEAMKAVEGERR